MTPEEQEIARAATHPLLPCPFCGGEAGFHKIKPGEPIRWVQFVIACFNDGCPASEVMVSMRGIEESGLENIIWGRCRDLWNRRKSPKFDPGATSVRVSAPPVDDLTP